MADPIQPISRAVQAANNNAIIKSFCIEALGKDDSVVRDVTSLFTTEVSAFNAKSRLRARLLDTSRSFIERVVSFPDNIEVEATYTFSNPHELAQSTAAPTPFQAAGMRTGCASVVMHYSMVKLPEKPMMPREETGPTMFGRPDAEGNDPQSGESLGCWPDYSVRIRR